MTPKCEHCHYSRSIGSTTAVMCCRYPPTVTEVKDNTITSHFPLVNLGAWCGEWKQRKSILDMARSVSDIAISSTKRTRRYAR